MKRASLALAVLAASVLALAGCAGGQSAETGDGDGKVTVVASTNVYGQIAEAIGGDEVEVTSIIAKASQDPHSYEASARDQLLVSRADLIIENGGGYDAFMDQLIEGSGTTAPVITVATLSHSWPGEGGDDHADEGADHAEDDHDHAEDDHDHADHGHADHGHIEGFNEHVWYDVHAMAHLASDIAAELEKLDPAHAELFQANAATFTDGIDGLEQQLADIAAAHGGETVFVTEPVPLYLTEAAGLKNITPAAFSEAVEEGQDVAPATLLESLRLVAGADVVVANAQTGGAETTAVIDEATAHGVPIVEFTETLPADTTYLEWMTQNIADLQSALQ